MFEKKTEVIADGTEKAAVATPDPTPSATDNATPASASSSSDGGLPDPVAQMADAGATVYEGFDPEKHKVGPDGKPVLTPTGRYAKKARGANTVAGVSRPQSANAPGVVGAKADNLPVAKQVTNIGINLAVRFLGPEWAPVEKAEAENVAFAFRDYFDARGVPQLPPEVVLILALTAYAAPRLNHDNTRTKIAKIFQRVKDWRMSLKAKK